jgi:alkyl hydroperoxide reductase subunit F
MSLNLNFNMAATKKANILDASVIYDHIIIGGGPAAFSAALYAARKGLKTGVIAQKIGGQLLNTSSVDNYLGITNVSGEDLSDAFYEHVVDLGVSFLSDVSVIDIQKNDLHFYVKTSDQQTFQSKTLMIATGSNPRKLQVPGEDEFSNKGVAYCAICDAPLFKDKKVIIAGGGNSAVEAAIDVAKWASEVILVHRSEFRADQIVLDQMMSNEKITVFKQTQILEIVGEAMMNGVLVKDKTTNQTRTIKADGIFIEIGNVPNSSLVNNFVDLNDFGEIIIDDHQMTSVPGCFAAGDVTTVSIKQIIVSVADGAKAALGANEYINHTFSK